MSWTTRCFYGPLHEVADPLVLRRVMMRFWSPFCRGLVGPDLHTYDFKKVFDSIRTCDSDFTCQVNGQVGNARLIEDFFIFVLCGFDFVDVKVEKLSVTDVASDPCNFRGAYTLAHTRPFLGWIPSRAAHSLGTAPSDNKPDVCNDKNIDGPGSEEQTSGANSLISSRGLSLEQQTRLLKVPFSARMEGSESGISHIILRSPVVDVIMGSHDCPATLQSCLKSDEALKAVVTLRRANVRPELITDKALIEITAKKESWASALGIL
ncbi:hypothetical protein MOQ_004361 [Trypanosoma cruzi marinkellei]|uniref:Uncharacterized protein n=1 Tax=Trypanosoma cruzi marinkellei TaxID=85056 RepID=K2M9Q8_TRYCR|nr:hypothetical protein MOQ_004361 [Trypanosoma cruzi marinkellei]